MEVVKVLKVIPAHVMKVGKVSSVIKVSAVYILHFYLYFCVHITDIICTLYLNLCELYIYFMHTSPFILCTLPVYFMYMPHILYAQVRYILCNFMSNLHVIFVWFYTLYVYFMYTLYILYVPFTYLCSEHFTLISCKLSLYLCTFYILIYFMYTLNPSAT